MQTLENVASGHITKVELNTAIEEAKVSPRAQEAIVGQIVERANSEDNLDRQAVFEVLEENKKDFKLFKQVPPVEKKLIRKKSIRNGKIVELKKDEAIISTVMYELEKSQQGLLS